MSRNVVRLSIGFTVLLALLLIPLTASAHEQVESGNYVFEVGWLQEPVIVGERNGLELFVASKDAPEEGIADITTLQFTVEYGSASQNYDILPAEDDPGHYSAAFIPMVEGQYTFHLTGTVNDEPVDVSVEPEEVVPAGNLAFPSAAGTTSASGGSAQTLALYALGLGAAALVLSGLALLRRKA
jgi:hypothetical protein